MLAETKRTKYRQSKELNAKTKELKYLRAETRRKPTEATEDQGQCPEQTGWKKKSKGCGARSTLSQVPGAPSHAPRL